MPERKGAHKSVYDALIEAFRKRLFRVYETDPTDLHQWRDRILVTLYLMALAGTLVVALPVRLYLASQDLWIVVLVNRIALLWGVFVLCFRHRLSFALQAVGAIVFTYLIGVTVLWQVGPYSVGFMWLFASVVIASVFIGLRGALAATVLNACTFAVFGWFVALDAFPWLQNKPYHLFQWVIMTCNFLMLNFITAVPVAVMTGGLQRSLNKEKNARADLDLRRKDLEQAKDRLEREIEEREEAQEALKESERKYRLLADNAGVGILLIQEGKLVYMNPIGLDFMGYTQEELTESPFIEHVHPDDRERLTDNYMRKMRGEHVTPGDIYRIFNKEGVMKWVQCRAELVVWEGKETLLAFLADADEMMQAEEALRESERKYRLLADNAGVGILLTQGDKIVYVNPIGLEFMGYTQEELTELPFIEHVHPDDRERLIDNYMKKMRGEYVPEGPVYRIFNKDGVMKWVQSRSELVVWEGKETLLTFLADVDEMVQAEEALRESERKYRLLADNASIGIVLTRNGKMIYANPKVYEFAKYSEEDLMSRPFIEFIHPDDRQWLVDTYLKKLRGEDVPQGSVYRFIDAEGRTRWIRSHSTTVEWEGQKTLLTFFTNMDKVKEAEEAKKRSEERYSLLVKHAPVGIIQIDPASSGILSVNDTMCRYTGFSELKLLSMSLSELFYPCEGPGECITVTKGSPPGERHEEATECRLKNKDGNDLTVILNTSIDFKDKAFERVTIVVQDVTERKRMEQELLKARQLESIGILAGGIAHDFNNLLTGIMGNISLAKMDLDEKGRAYRILNQAEKASARATDLTLRLLTFSKGGEPMTREVSVKEVIEEAARFALGGSEIRCDIEVSEEIPTVEIDPGQIDQVIRNLISNAIQASPADGPIEIEVRNCRLNPSDGIPLKPGDYVRITCKDRGGGIPPENIHKIFDPYFTTKEHGNGLGLTTAYSIVKRHNGYIAVESYVGRGTCFTIYLPASKQEQSAFWSNEREAMNGKGKILVMDDEELILDLVEQMLPRMGYKVAVARDGSEALDMYRQAARDAPFDAVILDLTVPGGMGGKETVGELKRIDPEAKVIVSSGYGNDPIMTDYASYGFSGVVAKPYTMDRLGKALDGVVGADSEND